MDSIALSLTVSLLLMGSEAAEITAAVGQIKES